MIANTAYQQEIRELVATNGYLFVTNLSESLKSNAFANRMLIAPRRLAQIGQEEYDHFFNFLETQDNRQVFEHGHRLALEGLGQITVLGVMSALRRECFAAAAAANGAAVPLFELTECYTSALLEGYMYGREEELRKEQQRTLNAFLRTQS